MNTLCTADIITMSRSRELPSRYIKYICESPRTYTDVCASKYIHNKTSPSHSRE